MKELNWGMIGCGSVTEVKSGPAFSKVKNSRLLAVSSRNYIKAQDYCSRHQNPYCFENISQLISHPDIDAIYIATPPDSHASLTIKALQAGKSVYVEKPMARTYNESLQMLQISEQTNSKLFVAYYRRALKYFRFILNMLEMEIIGQPTDFSIELLLPPRPDDFNSNKPWRVNPEIAGGGYFYDLASHQLDLIFFLLGEIKEINSMAFNDAGLYQAEDSVDAIFELTNGIEGIGKWRFAESGINKKDSFVINGTKGSILFSTFAGTPVCIKNGNKVNKHPISFPKHIQLPMIESVVNEINGVEKSYSDKYAAAEVNKWLEIAVKNYYN